MKGDIHSFNMRYSGMPCPKNLQRYGPGEGPSESPLVTLMKHFQPDQLLYLWDLLLAYDTMEVFPLLASTVLR